MYVETLCVDGSGLPVFSCVSPGAIAVFLCGTVNLSLSDVNISLWCGSFFVWRSSDCCVRSLCVCVCRSGRGWGQGHLPSAIAVFVFMCQVLLCVCVAQGKGGGKTTFRV